MTKEIVKTRASKNAETLGALYIYIYIYRYFYRQMEFAYLITHTSAFTEKRIDILGNQ